jgi:hypothetical protein
MLTLQFPTYLPTFGPVHFGAFFFGRQGIRRPAGASLIVFNVQYLFA